MKKLMVAMITLWPLAATAHEDHEPLPTTGATVRGDRLMLSASAAKSIGLQTAKVELAEVRRSVHAVASVELPWTQQAFVTTLVAGKVDQVLVKPGETVSAGQELARISSMELENMQLTMLQAWKEKSLATRVLDRQLAAGEGIAAKILVQTQTEVKQQSTRFNLAWQMLKAIGLSDEILARVRDSGETVGSISIFSPIDGVISATGVRPGQIVQPTEHLYHIVDLSRVWAVAKVLEADAGYIQPQLPVTATFAALPDERFDGPIDHIELRLNPDRTLSVKVLLDNSRGLLKPGMFGQADIQLESEKAVVCPKDALIHTGSAAFALVEESAGKYTRKPVTVRSTAAETAEIEDGLFPGDQVVTAGSHELAALFTTAANRFPPRPAAQSAGSERKAALGQVELPTDQKTFASAPIEGRVRRILVEHGQRVKRGHVLAELESLPFKVLQLDLLQARADIEQVAVDLKRLQSLSQSDSVAHKDLWQLQTQHDTYHQKVLSIRRKLALIGLSEAEIAAIENSTVAEPPGELAAVLPIRAPSDGLIAEFDLVPGQVVERQHRLFELYDPTRIWVQAFLFEQDASRVAPGQPVEVTLAADPRFRARGKVDRLNPVLHAHDRALSVWTELENSDSRLKEGMAAILSIDTSKSELATEN